MSKSPIERFGKEVLRRHGIGHTLAEIVEWLAGKGLKTTEGSVWRYVRRPTRGPAVNRRHEGWRKRREAGESLAEIARTAGVSRQAVAKALKQ